MKRNIITKNIKIKKENSNENLSLDDDYVTTLIT